MKNMNSMKNKENQPVFKTMDDYIALQTQANLCENLLCGLMWLKNI
jgi:hypothetical protein